jgi:hypothetical protein
MLEHNLKIHINESATAAFAVLARRLRDTRQPITPEIREALAQIVEAMSAIHDHQRALQRELQDGP